MFVDTTIHGYVHDGGAYHVACTDRRPGDHIPGEDCRHSDDPVYGLFSHDDDGHGLSCDKCGWYIFEPDLPRPAGLDVDWDAIAREAWGQ